MELASSYDKDYMIRIEHIDFKGDLKLSSLFTFFQDIAGLHAESIGMGRDELYGQYGVVWVLARIRVDVIKYPKWNDTISITTWPQEPSRIGFDRDYLVRDDHGNVLARAISTWAIIELDSRKLRKPKSIFINYPQTIKERAIDCRLGGLRSTGQLEPAYEKVVRFSDIDVNEHLNNSKYVDIIMDCFSLDFYKQQTIKSIEINYSNEALPGDTISIRKDKLKPNSNTIYIEGINDRDRKLVFKSQIIIETQ